MIDLYQGLSRTQIDEINATAYDVELSFEELEDIARATGRALYTVQRWFGYAPERLRLVPVSLVGVSPYEALTSIDVEFGVRLIIGVMLHSGIEAHEFTKGRHERAGTLTHLVKHFGFLVREFQDDWKRLQLREFTTSYVDDEFEPYWEWMLVYSFPQESEYSRLRAGDLEAPESDEDEEDYFEELDE